MKPFLVELTTLASKDLKGLASIEDDIITELKELKTNPKKGHGLVQNLSSR